MKEESFLELDGKISFVTKRNGRETGREELDGEVMLRGILHLIERSLDEVIRNPKLLEEQAV